MQRVPRASVGACRRLRSAGGSRPTLLTSTHPLSRSGRHIFSRRLYVTFSNVADNRTNRSSGRNDTRRTDAVRPMPLQYAAGNDIFDRGIELYEWILRSMDTPPKGFENFFPKKNKGEPASRKEAPETGPAGNPSEKPPPPSSSEGASEKPSEGAGRERGPSSNPFRDFGGSGKRSDGGGGRRQNPTPPQMGQVIAVTILMIAAAMLLSNDDSPNSDSREVTWTDFRNHMLEPGFVEKIVVTNKKTIARVYMKPGSPSLHSIRSHMSSKNMKSDPFDQPTVMEIGLPPSNESSKSSSADREHQYIYRFAIGSVDSFEKKMDEAQRELGIQPRDFVRVQYADESSLLSEALSVLPSFMLAGLVFMGLRGMAGGGVGGGGGMGGIFRVGKSTHKKFTGEGVKSNFSDVAGCQEAKKEIMEFVDFLKDSERFLKLGAKIPKGALLCGPPGTGKTLLAKAVAGEAGVPFFSISGSDFIEMFVGVGPSRVRDLFKEARENAPCIVFIDEIDAVGRERGKGGMSGGNDERENTLNQLLVEMDGFNPSTGVVVLAGTNRVDILDKALTRPGRFDRQIMIDLPDLQGRKEIFLVHLNGITLDDDASAIAGRLAGLTPGFAGADIANLCNEAAIQAARRKGETVEVQDFEKATDRIIGGLESGKMMSEKEKSIVAHHEAGHAVAGWFLKHADPLLKVTIIPRSNGALGYAQYLPKEINLRNWDQIMDIVCMALAGRASEEIFFGRVTTGAADDLRRVTDMIYSTIQLYGMNDRVGQLAFPKDPNAFGSDKPYSEATAQAMDEEARIIVENAYAKTLELLREKKGELEKVANLLLEKETITHDDVYDLIGPRPFDGGKLYEEYVSRRHYDANKEITKKEAEEIVDDQQSASPPLTPGLI